MLYQGGLNCVLPFPKPATHCVLPVRQVKFVGISAISSEWKWRVEGDASPLLERSGKPLKEAALQGLFPSLLEMGLQGS
jgi:hypothetical protein